MRHAEPVTHKCADARGVKRERERELREGREKSVSATLSYANPGTPGAKGRMQIGARAI